MVNELIDVLLNRQPHIPLKDMEAATKHIFDTMAHALEQGTRIEIRGFGSFALRYRPPRRARNPKTGAYVETQGKYAPHFKPGKELRERVNNVE